MNEFQTELDIATIDFNHKLKLETQTLVQATELKITCLDLFTNGLIAQYFELFIPKNFHKGYIVCNDAEGFTQLLSPPSGLYQNIPSTNFVEETACFLTKRFNMDIGITIAGIQNIPINKQPLNQKIFLGYTIQGTKSSRIIECSGTKQTVTTQLINAFFGYLTMFIKKNHNKKI